METAIVALVVDLTWSQSGGAELILMLIGVSLGFDAIDHNILLDQLWGIGNREHCFIVVLLLLPGQVPVGIGLGGGVTS